MKQGLAHEAKSPLSLFSKLRHVAPKGAPGGPSGPKRSAAVLRTSKNKKHKRQCELEVLRNFSPCFAFSQIDQEYHSELSGGVKAFWSPQRWPPKALLMKPKNNDDHDFLSSCQWAWKIEVGVCGHFGREYLDFWVLCFWKNRWVWNIKESLKGCWDDRGMLSGIPLLSAN